MATKFSKETYLYWYELMQLIRQFELMAEEKYKMEGKIRGFFHAYVGQEAIAAGAMTATRPEDLFITAYRDHGLAIAKGVSVNSCTGILALGGYDELSRLSSSYYLVREIEARQGPFDRTLPFYSVQMYDQTLPFYLKRPVTLVQYIDEFALGLDAEPDKGIQRVEDWKKRWAALEQGYAILSPSNYEQIAAGGLPMRVLARDPRRVIVSRQ